MRDFFFWHRIKVQSSRLLIHFGFYFPHLSLIYIRISSYINKICIYIITILSLLVFLDVAHYLYQQRNNILNIIKKPLIFYIYINFYIIKTCSLTFNATVEISILVQTNERGEKKNHLKPRV